MLGFLKRLQPRNPGYARYEAWCMRLGLAILLYFNLPVQAKYSEQPIPNGLALWGMDFTWAGDAEIMKWMMWILIPVLVCYVFGILRWLALPYMLTLSLAVGTLKNSQGSISHVYQALTMVLLAQAAWHLYHQIRIWIGKPHPFAPTWNARAMEIFVTQSAIAAIYLTTAITKLVRSDGAWLWQIRKIGVDLEKTWNQDYYHKLEQDSPNWALGLKNLVTDHPWVAIILFGPGLIAELIAPIALYGRLRAFIIGVLLIILHFGAIHIMKLTFEQNMALLLIYFINVPYWIGAGVGRLRPASG
ncbi:MAG: hypothetical protein AAGJ79_03470 [Verrucomicrobiota bacterium]